MRGLQRSHLHVSAGYDTICSTLEPPSPRSGPVHLPRPALTNLVAVSWFEAQSPVVQALLGGLVTWAVTAAGAAGVVLLRRLNQRLLDVMLGFAAGVMLAASFWSLLAPAIQLAGSLGIPSWLPAASGLVLGGLFLRGMDAVLPHLHPGYPRAGASGW